MGGKGSGPKARYPWDLWLDGNPHIITPADYTATFTTFRTMAYRTAAARRLRVSVRVDGQNIIIKVRK